MRGEGVNLTTKALLLSCCTQRTYHIEWHRAIGCVHTASWHQVQTQHYNCQCSTTQHGEVITRVGVIVVLFKVMTVDDHEFGFDWLLI